MQKGITLKVLLYFTGMVCLFLFLITKNGYLMDWLTLSGTPYGNLYKNCRVDVFKIPMEPTKQPPETYNRTDIDSCDIILIGDSFISECPGHHYFGVELSKRLNKKVFQLEIKPDLFHELNRSGIGWTEKERIILFETGESGIIKNFSKFPDLRPVPIERTDEGINADIKRQSILTKIRTRWFVGTEKNYSYFIKNNVIVESFINGWHSTLFHKFGIISDLTPVYSLDPPMLFESRNFGDRMTSFYFDHNDRLINRTTDNIKTISDSLKTLYNIEFVFLSIPDKYTLYHGFINDDEYDNYLPRLQDDLLKKGIPTIDLYQPYLNSTVIVYHPSDNHWVSEGVAIALDETVKGMTDILH